MKSERVRERKRDRGTEGQREKERGKESNREREGH